MKNLIKLSIILCCFFLSSCYKTSDKYDGKIVKDKDGNLYRLKHNIGDSYFITELDTAEINSLSKFTK